MESIDVRALSALLYPQADDSDEDTKHIGPIPSDLGRSNPPQCTKYYEEQKSKRHDGWVEEEREKRREEKSGEEIPDPRPQPHYEINYRQRVTTSHVYLPMSLGGCEEDLVVRVELPGDILSDVTLEVTQTSLTISSPTHHLSLPLPRAVNQKQGVAAWDPATHALVVTLPTVPSVNPL